MDLASLTPLDGGWSGETFLGDVGGERVVVRIYGGRGLERGDQAPEVDAAVLRLVRGLLPVPDVVEVRRADLRAGTPGLLVTSYVEGVRGDLVLPGLDADGRRRLGRHVGEVVAILGSMPVLHAGAFTDSELTLGDLGGPESLLAWSSDHLARWDGWSPDEREGLLEVADAADHLLETVTRRCLVHSDLNPKNLLVDPVTLAVTGVVDWEFVHAGHPFTDLGNVLRFERSPDYTAGVLEAYAARHGTPERDAVALGRAADLWSLVDLTNGGASPVAERAAVLLREIARTRDPSAWPTGWPLT